ncbi:MAG TPA: MFS transporter, partial [Anaerolineales bacterium]
GRQLSASQAGLLLSAMPVAMAVVAPVSGTLSDWVGSRLPSVLGMAILAAGLFLLARLGPQAPLAQVALALGVAGLGIGIFVSPNTSALMGSAPRHRQGIAAGILATARNVGMVLGVGLSGAVFTTVLARRSAAAAGGLYDAIRISLYAAAGFALLGLILSAARGNSNTGA